MPLLICLFINNSILNWYLIDKRNNEHNNDMMHTHIAVSFFTKKSKWNGNLNARVLDEFQKFVSSTVFYEYIFIFFTVSLNIQQNLFTHIAKAPLKFDSNLIK